MMMRASESKAIGGASHLRSAWDWLYDYDFIILGGGVACGTVTDITAAVRVLGV